MDPDPPSDRNRPDANRREFLKKAGQFKGNTAVNDLLTGPSPRKGGEDYYQAISR